MQVKQNLINSQDQNSQIENYEKPEAEDPNENDSEEIETNKIAGIPNLLLQILPDDKIAEGYAGILMVNIHEATIHSGLGSKPGTKLLGLNDTSKVTLRKILSGVNFS